MIAYLDDNPPVRSQFRRTRRARATGAIVIHTAENATDLALPDDGAEGVAGFISRRSDPGSYHSVVDSDSIVPVGRYEWEMYHEGTGGNRWSLGLAFACQASQWPKLPEGWITGAIENGAVEAAKMAAWVHDTTGITVPARRITPAQYRAGQPGFIGHGELDPSRRSDPGPGFPWGRFLARFSQLTDQEMIPMPPQTDNPYEAEVNEALQLLAEHAGYGGDLDGWFGPMALAALHRLKNESQAAQAEADRQAAAGKAALDRANALRSSLDKALADRDQAVIARVAMETDLRDALDASEEAGRDLAEAEALLTEARSERDACRVELQACRDGMTPPQPDTRTLAERIRDLLRP